MNMPLNVVLLNVGRVIQAKGGAEKVFCEMANALAERGMNVHAVCCEDKEGLPGYPLHDSVHFINAGNRPSPWFDKGWIARMRALMTLSRKARRSTRAKILCRKQAIQLKGILTSLQADVIVAFQPEASFIIKSLLRLQVPVAAVFHNAVERFTGAPEFDIFRNSVLQSSVLTVLMPEYREEARRALPGLRVEYIPNAISAIDKQADLLNPIVITVGRADAQKRHLLLVEAFERLKDDFPEWTLEIWGETQARYGQVVLREVEHRGLKKVIQHCGTTNRVDDQLLRASIFAFPSAYEGFSLALGEAMSAGLPAVGCTDCPSVNTLIRSGENGLLTEPTAEAFAEGLTKLMEDRELRVRLGRQARNDMKKYAPKEIWAQWEALLNEIAREG